MNTTANTSAPAPPPNPEALPRQLMLDGVLRTLGVGVLLAVLAAGSWWETLDPSLATVVMLLAAGLWIALGAVSARVWRQFPRINQWLDEDPPAAEAAVAAALRRYPLHRPVRLLLYHRLAVLRHRQRRFTEAAALCQAILAQRLGSAANVRGHLLLMLSESRLELGDLGGAYAALTELYRLKLSLAETLQRLSLQTRYEVACGYHHHALQELPHKISLIELMPGPQCGAMHALLAIAAAHAGQPPLAQWLRRRAELLCTPEQLAAFRL